MQLLTAKPVIYLVNVSQDDYIRKKNKWCGPAAAIRPRSRTPAGFCEPIVLGSGTTRQRRVSRWQARQDQAVD